MAFAKRKKPQTPRYKHDCTNCTFLGRHTHETPEGAMHMDMYVCIGNRDGKARMNPVIRWSSDGPDYSSNIQSIIFGSYAYRCVEMIEEHGYIAYDSARKIAKAVFERKHIDITVYPNRDAPRGDI